jgi:hypothetical protein
VKNKGGDKDSLQRFYLMENWWRTENNEDKGRLMADEDTTVIELFSHLHVGVSPHNEGHVAEETW